MTTFGDNNRDVVVVPGVVDEVAKCVDEAREVKVDVEEREPRDNFEEVVFGVVGVTHFIRASGRRDTEGELVVEEEEIVETTVRSPLRKGYCPAGQVR